MAKLLTHIYTDGGCQNPQGPGGWGVYCIDKVGTAEETKHRLYGSLPVTTNNRAEIKAITEALKYSQKQGWTEPTIHVDSKYALNYAKGKVFKSEEMNWVNYDGSDVKNADLLKEQIVELRKFNGIKWKWVKGHSGNHGNDEADALATKGKVVAKSGREYEEVTVEAPEAKDKPKAKKFTPNKIIAGQRWYFDSQNELRKSKDGRTILYTGSHDKQDSFAGRKSHLNKHSVTFVKTLDPVMDLVRSEHLKSNAGCLGTATYVKIDSILSSGSYNEVMTAIESKEVNDKLLFVPTSGAVGLTSFSGEVISHDLNPPIHAFRLLDDFYMLEKQLERYLDKFKDITVTDVTDFFYESKVVGKGKSEKVKTEFRKSIQVSTKTITLTVDLPNGTERDIILTLSHTAPPRNTLSALVKQTPKVKVLTWPEGSKAYRLAFVIETEDDVSLWTSLYSNVYFYN